MSSHSFLVSYPTPLNFKFNGIFSLTGEAKVALALICIEQINPNLAVQHSIMGINCQHATGTHQSISDLHVTCVLW